MALFVIDLDERIIKHDSELQFTLKSVFKKLDILSIVSTQNIIFCKKILWGQELRNSSKIPLLMSPGAVIWNESIW